MDSFVAIAGIAIVLFLITSVLGWTAGLALILFDVRRSPRKLATVALSLAALFSAFVGAYDVTALSLLGLALALFSKTKNARL